MFLLRGQHPGWLRNCFVALCCSPKGPVTVTFLFWRRRYDVMSFFANRSPISSSTPGGIESGVLPSLEGRCVVAEKGRRGAVCAVWKAGTRKLGNVAVGEGEAATALCKACLPILGASIAWVVAELALQLVTHAASVQARQMSLSKKIGRRDSIGWLRVGRGLVSNLVDSNVVFQHQT